MNPWQRELQRTPDCIAIERFAESLTAAEREHVAHCVRCEAEMALWQQFKADEAAADEGAAVQWVAAETRRRLKAPADDRKPAGWSGWIGSLRPRTLALAATLLVVAAIGYVTWDGGVPSLTNPAAGALIYRSGGVQLIAPSGDVAALPVELRWAPTAEAARYDVELREVDGTVVWRGSVAETHVALPASVAAQIVPGRTFLWQVKATTSDGAVLAESETGRFRMPLNTPPRKQS